MKERPIIFNGEMVRAILEGRKTQTRRVIKFPTTLPFDIDQNKITVDDSARAQYGDVVFSVNDQFVSFEVKCPYGQPGDRLWVRETFWAARNDHITLTCYRATVKGTDKAPLKAKWSPSIHMPRDASRITLEVKDVRVEGVQDITEEDVWEEGLNEEKYYDWLDDVATIGKPGGSTVESPKDQFAGLWDQINNKDGRRWEDNPWVWVVEFEMLKGV